MHQFQKYKIDEKGNRIPRRYEREAGILLPVSSLPSPYGIGTLGKEAFRFVDFLKAAGQKCWQVLPVGPTGFGDSPYQSYSTFAGNPYFIDLDRLVEEGLLTQAEAEMPDWGNDPASVDYEKLYDSRISVLQKAFQRGQWEKEEDYQFFCKENGEWLEDYSLFMALKYHFQGEGMVRLG